MKISFFGSISLLFLTSISHSAALYGGIYASAAGDCTLPSEPGAVLVEASSSEGYIPGSEVKVSRTKKVSATNSGKTIFSCNASGRLVMKYDKLQSAATSKATTYGSLYGRTNTTATAVAMDELEIDTSDLPVGAVAEVAVITVVDWNFKGIATIESNEPYSTHLYSRASLSLLQNIDDPAGRNVGLYFCVNYCDNNFDLRSRAASGSKTFSRKVFIPKTKNTTTMPFFTELSVGASNEVSFGPISGNVTTAGLKNEIPTVKIYIKSTPNVKIKSSSGQIYECPNSVPACR